MGFIDKLKKYIRFRKQEQILNNADARNTEYIEHAINGKLVRQDVFIDGESVTESLDAKEKYVDAAALKERKNREEEVAKAEKQGRPLTKDQVIDLRKTEEQKRLETAQAVRLMQWQKGGR